MAGSYGIMTFMVFSAQLDQLVLERWRFVPEIFMASLPLWTNLSEDSMGKIAFLSFRWRSRSSWVFSLDVASYRWAGCTQLRRLHMCAIGRSGMGLR